MALTPKWPVDITTTTTAETLAEAKTVWEIVKLATDQEVDGFDALLNKYDLSLRFGRCHKVCP